MNQGYFRWLTDMDIMVTIHGVAPNIIQPGTTGQYDCRKAMLHGMSTVLVEGKDYGYWLLALF